MPADYMTRKIETIEDAIAFIKALHADGKLFHFDDSAEDIIRTNGAPLFTREECPLINARNEEMRKLAGFDPFEIAAPLEGPDPEEDDAPGYYLPRNPIEIVARELYEVGDVILKKAAKVEALRENIAVKEAELRQARARLESERVALMLDCRKLWTDAELEAADVMATRNNPSPV